MHELVGAAYKSASLSIVHFLLSSRQYDQVFGYGFQSLHLGGDSAFTCV